MKDDSKEARKGVSGLFFTFQNPEAVASAVRVFREAAGGDTMTTKKAQHTGGPWDYRPYTCGCGQCDSDEFLRVFAPGGIPVTDVSTDSEEAEADARLIAAAPDLLEALEAIVSTLESLGPLALPKVVAAKAAIAKARGE